MINETVGTWQPIAALGAAHARALDAACPQADGFAVDERARTLLAEVTNADDETREPLFQGRPSAQLIHWLRVLTLVEARLPGGDMGAKSPVIALARILRERGDYPVSLTPWIRSVSDNRFLPYGSLKDRLGSGR